jgi:hypothetical protein
MEAIPNYTILNLFVISEEVFWFDGDYRHHGFLVEIHRCGGH